MNHLYISLLTTFIVVCSAFPSIAQNPKLIRVNLFFDNPNASALSCHHLDQFLLSQPGMRTSRTLASGKYFGIYETENGMNQQQLQYLLAQRGFHTRCYHETEADKPINPTNWAAYLDCTLDVDNDDSQKHSNVEEKAFNDCNTAQNICHGSSFNVIQWGPGSITSSPDGNRNPLYSSFGTASPWNNPWGGGTNDGCLQSGELHTIWLLMTVTAPGDLEWSFDFPADVGGSTVFMDWVIWRNTPTLCADIAANNANAAPLRCNWNLGPDFTLNTGMGHTGMIADSANLPLHGASQERNFEVSTPANVGDQFILLLDNYSGLNFNASFDFQLSPTSCEVCGVLLDTDWRMFDIEAKNQEVVLSWQTDKEDECQAYLIERSNDGMNWLTIGSVEGHGTTLATNYYEFVDKTPHMGANYYRIRQQLFSGATLLSEMRFVEFNADNVPHVQVHPNPSSGNVIQLSTHGFDDQSAKIELVDMYGQSIFQEYYNLSNNHQNISINPPYELDKGIYIVLLHTNTGTLKQKIIIQ